MLLERDPSPRLVFPGEEVEWGNNMREICDEFVTKICKTQEESNSLNRGRWFPFLDGGEFDRVHFDLSLTDNHAEELNMWCIKDAFGKLKEYKPCSLRRSKKTH